MIFPYTSYLAGNELVPRLTINTASEAVFLVVYDHSKNELWATK